MKRIWGWLSEYLFVTESVHTETRSIIAVDTPEEWSLSKVNELRWA